MEKIISLADLKPDPKNARKHTPKNIGMIEASLQQVGAARSGVIDDDGMILAGNGTYEALASVGIERVRVVEADGNEWIVVQRKGLTEEQKRILSISDNRSAELATWDGPTLEQSGVDLQPWFTPEQLKAQVFLQRPSDGVQKKDQESEWIGMPEYGEVTTSYKLNVSFRTETDRDAFVDKFGLRIDKKEAKAWQTRWPWTDREDLASVRFEDQDA